MNSKTGKLEYLLEMALEAWATLDHNQHEYLVSELGNAIDDVRLAFFGENKPIAEFAEEPE